MIQTLLILLALFSLPTLGQNLQPTNKSAACRVVKSKEYLDTYYICGTNPGRADVLQISLGEAGPKLHYFTSPAAWAEHFGKIDHHNCADFKILPGSKEDRRIQKGFRRSQK